MLTDDQWSDLFYELDRNKLTGLQFGSRADVVAFAKLAYDRACDDCAKACVAEPKINDCDQWCCRPEREDCAKDCRSLKHGDSE